jgi:hypothetical protein
MHHPPQPPQRRPQPAASPPSAARAARPPRPRQREARPRPRRAAATAAREERTIQGSCLRAAQRGAARGRNGAGRRQRRPAAVQLRRAQRPNAAGKRWPRAGGGGGGAGKMDGPSVRTTKPPPFHFFEGAPPSAREVQISEGAESQSAPCCRLLGRQLECARARVGHTKRVCPLAPFCARVAK